MKLMLILAAVLVFPSVAGAEIINPLGLPAGPVYVDDAEAADDGAPIMPVRNPQRMDRRERMGAGAGTRGQRDPQVVAKRQQLRRALIAQFDANGDGRLGPRERMRAARVLRRIENRLTQPMQQGKAGQYRKFMRRYDVNGDGQVGPREVPQGAADRLRRFDRDQDGWVEPGEL